MAGPQITQGSGATTPRKHPDFLAVFGNIGGLVPGNPHQGFSVRRAVVRPTQPSVSTKSNFGAGWAVRSVALNRFRLGAVGCPGVVGTRPSPSHPAHGLPEFPGVDEIGICKIRIIPGDPGHRPCRTHFGGAGRHMGRLKTPIGRSPPPPHPAWTDRPRYILNIRFGIGAASSPGKPAPRRRWIAPTRCHTSGRRGVALVARPIGKIPCSEVVYRQLARARWGGTRQIELNWARQMGRDRQRICVLVPSKFPPPHDRTWCQMSTAKQREQKMPPTVTVKSRAWR